jgi:hexosaminidase
MTKTLAILMCAGSLLGLGAAAAVPGLVPAPVEMKETAGKPFLLQAPLGVSCDKTPGSEEAATFLSDCLKKSNGIAFTRSVVGHDISFLKGDGTLGAEGYTLSVTEKQVVISADAPAGFFYGAQTLRQLLPIPGAEALPATIPALEIKDKPCYAWRGMMLDVSRYFMDKDYVLHYLDIMAAHKLNVLHLHLIDDQGWRVEIKKYPKLTEIGGFRGEGDKREGGFYTQADIREMVAYAKARNITIVPEIELPAHTLSAIAAYPWLSCTGRQQTMPTVHFISDDLYCVGKPTTWEFLNDVLGELCELFPSTYIHIGGDEAKYPKWKACPDCQKKIKELGLKNERDLQGWMTCQIEDILKKKGRQIIGWDEIFRCGVSSTAGIMPWHDAKSAVDAAKKGNPIVLALTGYCYFDMPESKLRGERPGAAWLPPISLEKAYSWDPMPAGLTPEQQKNILGAHGCLWTDMFLHKPEIKKYGPANYCDYFTLPRAAALAEVCWTPKAQRSWSDFQRRMASQYVRYSEAGWTYRLPLPEVKIVRQADGSAMISANCPAAGGKVCYTTDGSDPTAASPVLNGEIKVATPADFRAISVAADGKCTSLVFETAQNKNRFPQFGTPVGEWKSGKVGNRQPIPVDFEATGLINANGTYQVTFVYTGGVQRLDIDKVEIIRNQTLVATDAHHGFTGGQAKDNAYTVKIDAYETGAAFKVRAYIYGDEGNDSNGVVLIRKMP